MGKWQPVLWLNTVYRSKPSAQAFKVYSFVSLCERRIQNQHMVTV